MIMKANKQIGFIYKNEESIDKILKDGEVVFERGFLREKTSTTLPITFGGVGKNLKDYKVYGNTVQNGEPTPDTPIEMVSCGDRTKNLLNVSNEYSVTTWQEIDVNLQPGDYIVNCTNTSTNVESGKASLMNFYHSDNTYDQLYFNRVDKVGTVTITAETTKVRIYSGSSYTVSNGKTTILTNLMIRKSNISDGTYEPYGYKIPVNVNNVITNIYLDEPLRKIGEYSDYIDFINGKVVRQLGENIPNLNDLSLSTNYTNVEYVRFLKPTDFVGYDLFGNYHLLCSHAIYSANPNNWDSINNVNKLYTGAERKSWWIGFEKGTGLDTIKQKLEGCSVIYRLATPTEETITLPNIPTVDGNNILNIETEITPSKVYIKYKSNT